MNLLLDLGNSLTGVKVLGTGVGTVHDSLTLVELVGIIKGGKTLSSSGITRVSNPTVSLHEHSRSQVLLSLPPITRARSGTAEAENTLVHTIELLTVLLGLKVLHSIGSDGIRDQPRLNRLVLLIDLGEVRDEIFDNIHVREGVDFDRLISFRDLGQTSKVVSSINVHGTRSTDTLTARTTESQSLILLVLDLNQSIENHRAALVHVDGVSLYPRLLGLIGVEAVDLEVLDALLLLRLQLQISGKTTAEDRGGNSGSHGGLSGEALNG